MSRWVLRQVERHFNPGSYETREDAQRIADIIKRVPGWGADYEPVEIDDAGNVVEPELTNR